MKPLTVLLATTMILRSSWLPVLAAPAGHVARESSYSRGDLFEQMEAKYRKYVRDTLARRGPEAKCNSKNAKVRKEWGSLTEEERRVYIKAVKCLYNDKPPVNSPQEIPGARNRYDDFVAAHIRQTLDIHANAYFFAWHRHFLWLYDQALRNECGYHGPTPYWDWTLNNDDLSRSPLFDGSETSFGGNGVSLSHGHTLVTAFGLLVISPGTGGGCVMDGPFTDLTVNLGLTLNTLPAGAPVPTSLNATGQNFTRPDEREAGLEYNPRCLPRDFNFEYSNQTRRSDVEYVLSCPELLCLLQRSDGGWEQANPEAAKYSRPRATQVHTAGHFSVGGQQNDVFATAGDPIFYLHHAQVDRLWTIWQSQNPEMRIHDIGAPRRPFGIPPDPAQADDLLFFPAVGDSIRLGDAGSTIDGDYCYRYE